MFIFLMETYLLTAVWRALQVLRSAVMKPLYQVCFNCVSTSARFNYPVHEFNCNLEVVADRKY